MGNAVEILYRKKTEARKKQAEKEKEIFQACLAWTFQQEEKKKTEEAERQEKHRKEKENERIKKDQEYMERCIKNIDREKQNTKIVLKKREEYMIKRKQDVTSMSVRKMKENENHIVKESEIISKNIINIEKRSEKSRKEMKTRMVSLQKKKVNDNKEFVRRFTTVEEKRKNEMEHNKRRIRSIEQRILRDRISWQHTLMTARRIQGVKKVSSKTLWAIGKKTVEKRRILYEKTQEKENSDPQYKFEIEWKQKRTIRQMNMNSDKINNRKENTRVKRTLPTVREDECVLLEVEQTTISPRMNTTTDQKASNGQERSKPKDDMKIKQLENRRFQRYYMPQKRTAVNNKQQQKLEIVSDAYESQTAVKMEQRRYTYTVSSRGSKTSSNNPQIRAINSNRQMINKQDNKQNEIKRSTTTTNESLSGHDADDIQISKKQSKQQIHRDKSINAPKPTGILWESKFTANTSSYNHRRQRIENVAKPSPRSIEEKQKQSEQKPKGILVKSKELQDRKQVVTILDPLMAKSHNLNQEKVEEIIGIKPLGCTIDKTSSERGLPENATVTRKDIDASEHGERKCNQGNKVVVKDDTTSKSVQIVKGSNENKNETLSTSGKPKRGLIPQTKEEQNHKDYQFVFSTLDQTMSREVTKETLTPVETVGKSVIERQKGKTVVIRDNRTTLKTKTQSGMGVARTSKVKYIANSKSGNEPNTISNGSRRTENSSHKVGVSSKNRTVLVDSKRVDTNGRTVADKSSHKVGVSSKNRTVPVDSKRVDIKYPNSSFRLVSSENTPEVHVAEAEEEIDSRKIKIVPIKPRANIHLNGQASLFLLDERISEVQRRINKMVNTSKDDSVVVEDI